MDTTRLSSKGQVIIPKAFRAAHHWDPGLELVIIDVGDGVLLRPRVPFEASTLEETAGCLRVLGPSKTAEEIEDALKQATRRAWRDSD